MPDFSSQTSSNVSWVDDLLVKDLSGHLKPFHQAKNAPDNPVAREALPTALEIAPSHELSTMQVAPRDDSFVFHHGGGQAHEPAVLVFHPEDHEQIEGFRENLPTDDSKKYSLEKIAQRIVEKNSLILDEKNKKLFEDILFDFFRNRKNSIIIKEYLAEKLISNGHTLPWSIIDHIISILKGIKERIDVEGGLVVRQSDIVVVPTETKVATTPKIVDQFSPVKSEDNATVKDSAPAKRETPVKVRVQEASATVGVDDFVAPPLPRVTRPEAFFATKATVVDVVNKSAIAAKLEKAKPVLVGPVQELESMSLVNFRRYGENGQERVKKVFQKINILEKESVTKKAQGIAAWRKSPVYKMYLDLGARSLMKGQEVSNLIAEIKAGGDETLTLEEFSAIGDLNKLLRF